MNQVLTATETTGDPFPNNATFIVFLDTYTDGWHVEYALDKESVTDKTTLNWKKWNSQPIQEHGELSRVLVYGMDNVLYRLNGGTQGATVYWEIPLSE